MLSGGEDSVYKDPVSGIISSNLTITASKELNNSLISCVAVAVFSVPVNSSALLLIQGMDEWMHWWMNGCLMNECIDGWMNALIDEWIDVLCL